MMVSDEYIAGFLDADGYVALNKCGSTGEEWRRRPEIAFTNCDKGILDDILEAMPGGKWTRKKPASPNHNISYSLRYRGEIAFTVMRRLLPYCRHQNNRPRFHGLQYERPNNILL